MIEEELKQSSLPNINDKTGGLIAGNSSYVTKVFKHKFTDPVNIFYVYEEELFNYKTNSFIVSMEGNKVRVIVMRPGQETVDVVLPYDVDKVLNLSRNVFACKLKDDDAVARLESNFGSAKGYRSKVVYQEFKGKILQINGDKNKLYSLVDEEGQMNLKVFICQNNDFDFVSQIPNIDKESPNFVRVFKNSSSMHENILI